MTAITAVWSESLCAFPIRTVLPPEVGESAQAMAGNGKTKALMQACNGRQKRSYLHHRGEFQHQLFTFGSLHDSNHGGVVKNLCRPILSTQTLLFTRHNFSPTRSVIVCTELLLKSSFH